MVPSSLRSKAVLKFGLLTEHNLPLDGGAGRKNRYEYSHKHCGKSFPTRRSIAFTPTLPKLVLRALQNIVPTQLEKVQGAVTPILLCSSAQPSPLYRQYEALCATLDGRSGSYSSRCRAVSHHSSTPTHPSALTVFSDHLADLSCPPGKVLNGSSLLCAVPYRTTPPPPGIHQPPLFPLGRLFSRNHKTPVLALQFWVAERESAPSPRTIPGRSGAHKSALIGGDELVGQETGLISIPAGNVVYSLPSRLIYRTRSLPLLIARTIPGLSEAHKRGTSEFIGGDGLGGTSGFKPLPNFVTRYHP